MNLPANVLAAASPAESTAPAAAPAGVKVVEEAAAYATANIISQVAAIVRGFVVARVLGPASFGIWNGLSIFMAYSGYTNLGLFVGMTREYCYFVGKNDRPKARVVRDTAFTFGTASALLVSLVIVMAAILVRQRYARPVIVGAMMMATIMLLDRVFQYHIALFRVERRILTLSVATILLALAFSVGAVAFVFRFGLYAIFGSFLASYLVGIGYLWWHANEHFRIAFDFSQLKKLIPIGLPLDVGGAADTLMNTAGSMVILLFLSTTELGYYGIGGTFIGLLMQFPSSLAWVLNPRLLERYGKTEDVRELWNHAVTPTVFVAYLLPILMAEAALAMAMVIRYLLPAYMPGVPAITILLFGNFFYALVYPTANLMVALNRQLAATVVRVGSALLNVAFIYAFLSIGLRLKGVALGTSCAYFVLGTTLTVLMMRYYFSSMKAIVRFLAGMYAPFGYMVALFIATGYLLPADATLGATKFVGVIALRGIVLAAAYAPILLHASRKPQFAELARQVAGSKLGSYLSWCSKRPTGSHR